jgi:hypothetical protein
MIRNRTSVLWFGICVKQIHALLRLPVSRHFMIKQTQSCNDLCGISWHMMCYSCFVGFVFPLGRCMLHAIIATCVLTDLIAMLAGRLGAQGRACYNIMKFLGPRCR